MTAASKKTTTMTFPMEDSDGPFPPNGGSNEPFHDEDQDGGAGDNNERAAQGTAEAAGMDEATATTMTTTSHRRDMVASHETLRSSIRSLRHDVTQETPAVDFLVPSIPVGTFDREPISIHAFVDGGMNVQDAVQRLDVCWYNPFYTKDVNRRGTFGFVFWLEALARKVEQAEPRVAQLLRFIQAPDCTTVDEATNAKLYAILATHGRFTEDGVEQPLLQRKKRDGIAMLRFYFRMYPVDPVDWILVRVAVEAAEGLQNRTLTCWDGDWEAIIDWQEKIARRLNAPFYRNCAAAKEDSIERAASNMGMWILFKSTMREGKAKKFLDRYTFRDARQVYEDLFKQAKKDMKEEEKRAERSDDDNSDGEEESSVFSEGSMEEASISDQEYEAVTTGLKPRRDYNYRFKLTVTDTGREQRSKSVAVVVSAIQQLLDNISVTTTSKPVLRPWRASNNDSPTIMEPSKVPRTESGLAPYLFDRFWDKDTGRYHAAIFLGYDGFSPATLAAYTRSGVLMGKVMPYFLTDRPIQDDAGACAGWLLGSTTLTDQAWIQAVLTEAVRPLPIEVARRRISLPGDTATQKTVYAIRLFGSAGDKMELVQQLTQL